MFQYPPSVFTGLFLFPEGGMRRGQVFGAQFAEEYSTMKSDAALEKLRTDRYGGADRF